MYVTIFAKLSSCCEIWMYIDFIDVFFLEWELIIFSNYLHPIWNLMWTDFFRLEKVYDVGILRNMKIPLLVVNLCP